MSRIAETLRRIKTPQRDGESRPRDESRLGSLVKRLASPSPAERSRPQGDEAIFPTLGDEWCSPDNLLARPAASFEIRERPRRFPWDADRISMDSEFEKLANVRPPTVAELTLPDEELWRLRALAVGSRERIKIKRLGVTSRVVQAIHRKWRFSEVVKVKCAEFVRLDLRKLRDDLEKRTGGLLVWWNEKGMFVIYRGKNYSGPPPQIISREQETRLDLENPNSNSELLLEDLRGSKKKFPVEREPTEYELVMDKCLADLGPRYSEWTGPKPVPVDGDKLREIDHSYKSPYRLLPYGVDPKLSDQQFRKLVLLAKQVPTQFVVSRTKGLQGLAKAMVKLWESTEIIKVAIKVNTQSTNNAPIAHELQNLTGCTLLGRTPEYIIFYRGKDFLPGPIAAAFEAQDAISFANRNRGRMFPDKEIAECYVPMPQRPEEREADMRIEEWRRSQEEEKRRAMAVKTINAARARRLGKQLDVAYFRKAKAEEALAEVERLSSYRQPPEDRETLTEEERYTLQKLGLKMHGFLLLGDRGVFAGIIENMHLHWKYRELVQLIYKGKPSKLEETARLIENESGGILVTITRTFRGITLLYYRGKNYQRPEELRPQNLLNKKQALEKFTQNQRREGLARHIWRLERDIRSLEYLLETVNGDDAEDLNETSEIVLPPDDSSPREFPKKTPSFSELGPVFRAQPLTNKERLVLRKKALQMGKAAPLHIGKNGVDSGMIRAIKIYLQRRALVKIVIKARNPELSPQDIIKMIEDGTGAAFVCLENHKLIFYRGWPDWRLQPEDRLKQNLSYNLVSAVGEEDALDFSLRNSSSGQTNTARALKSGDDRDSRVQNHLWSIDEASDQQEFEGSSDTSSGEQVSADFTGEAENKNIKDNKKHADVLSTSASSSYRSSGDDEEGAEDSAYSTGEETDDEGWNI